jgi:hypothetical protein
MRQKYLIIPEKDSLIIKESSELDKGVLQQVGEVTYDSHVVKVAKSGNIKELVGALRTPGFYPINDCATKLAESIIEIYKSKESDPVEIAFNDIEQLIKEEEKEERVETDADVAIDELLEENENEDMNGDDILKDETIKDLSSTLKIADEDDLIDDEDK